MNYPSITPRALADLLAQGKKIELIDVRIPTEYREMHIAQARNVPLDQLDPGELVQSRNGSQHEPLYVICRSGVRSQQACEKLLKANCTNVINIEGGTLAWAESGLPLVRGKKAIPLERQIRIVSGALILTGATLSWYVHPAFVGLSAFVGVGLIFAGITGICPMGMLIARMPWNQVQEPSNTCCAKS